MAELRFLERTLEACWALLVSEPGMDNVAVGLDDILAKMSEDLGIYPFQDDDINRLFECRFEFPKFGEKFTYAEAAEPDSLGFIDFLGGFPLDCVEMFVIVGEFSSKPETVKVTEGGKIFTPIPDDLFDWPESGKIVLNLTALPRNHGKWFAKNLAGEPKPSSPKWWFRVQIIGETAEWPVPGEFLGLGIRMFPGKYWNYQKSSPFIYSGGFMDTVYYTAARVTEVIDPTDEKPYATYKVQWRTEGEGADAAPYEVEVIPSDFAEYQVDDRVTIMKDAATEKTTQLWKDEDMKAPFGENWMIVPISFYGLEKEGS